MTIQQIGDYARACLISADLNAQEITFYEAVRDMTRRHETLLNECYRFLADNCHEAEEDAMELMGKLEHALEIEA